jgi:hypothetical protein
MASPAEDQASNGSGESVSLGAHLRQAARTAPQLGLEGPEFDDPNPDLPPVGFEFLWSVFKELSAARQSGFSPCPIAFRDIESWVNLTGYRLAGWEVDVIRQLDEVWMGVVNDTLKAKRGRDKGEGDKSTRSPVIGGGHGPS